MRDPLGQDLSQMSLVWRNDMVEALASRGTDQAFAKGIRSWNPDRCFQHPNIHGPQCVVNSGREHGIAIMDHEPVRVHRRSGRF
jgi:hypothetical protein